MTTKLSLAAALTAPALDDYVWILDTDDPAQLKKITLQNLLNPDSGTWAPVFTGITVGNGVETSSYAKVGKVVTIMYKLVFGTTTAVTGAVTFPAPYTSAVGSFDAAVSLHDVGTDFFSGLLRYSGGTFSIEAVDASAAAASRLALSAAVPFTWATGDAISFCVTYITT